MDSEFSGKPLERVITAHNLSKKLYEKGFSTTPLPSVKRQISQDKPMLNVVLNSVGKYTKYYLDVHHKH